MRNAIIALLTLLVTACYGARLQPVQAYGPDVFVIYATSRSDAVAHTDMLSAANEYCAKAGKQMAPISNKRVARRQFELQFSCK